MHRFYQPLLSAACLLMFVSHAGQVPAQTTIMLDFDAEIGTLHPELIGVNHPMTELCFQAGFNTETGEFNTVFYEAIAPLGLKHWRYPGGTGSGSYFWQRALGDYPREAGFYKPHTFCQGGGTAEHYHNFGTMELMDFLDRIGAHSVTVNLNFGSEREAAQAAADWVEFANALPGDNPNGGEDWAALRESLGHPAPYGIRYWEVGNELGGIYDSNGHYRNAWSWFYGLLPGQPGSEDFVQRMDNFLFGGSQAQYNDICAQGQHPHQFVTRPNDWCIEASLSDGQPSQVFYVRYPPAHDDWGLVAVYLSEEIGSAGQEWTRVEDLASWGPADQVYLFESAGGRVEFGNGVSGAIPDLDHYVGVQYLSIDKDGMDSIYCKIKLVDPDAQVSSSFFTDEFLDHVDAVYPGPPPFDCVSIHPYLDVDTHRVEAEHWRLQQVTSELAPDLVARRERLDELFAPDRYVDLLISEFNVIAMPSYAGYGCRNPSYEGRKLDYFGKSLSQCLALANGVLEMLRRSQEARIRTLNIHSLLPFDVDPAGTRDTLDPCGWDLTAMVGREGLTTYLNAGGLFYTLLNPRSGDRLLEPLLADCPIMNHVYQPGGIEIDLPYLSALAMAAQNGSSAALFVLNRATGLPDSEEEFAQITATVGFQDHPDFSYIRVSELGADSLWSYNTAAAPEEVCITHYPDLLFTPSLEHTFPPRTLTVFLLHNQPAQPLNLSITVTADLLRLTWNPVPGALSYTVYSSAEPWSGFTEDLTGGYGVNTWSAPVPAVNRFYHVTAHSAVTP